MSVLRISIRSIIDFPFTLYLGGQRGIWRPLQRAAAADSATYLEMNEIKQVMDHSVCVFISRRNFQFPLRVELCHT